MASDPNSSESSSSELFDLSIPSPTKLTLQIYQSIFQQCPAHNSLNSRINSLKTTRNSQRLLPSSALLKPSFGSVLITSETELPQKKKVLLLVRKGPQSPALSSPTSWMVPQALQKICHVSCMSRFLHAIDSKS